MNLKKIAFKLSFTELSVLSGKQNKQTTKSKTKQSESADDFESKKYRSQIRCYV